MFKIMELHPSSHPNGEYVVLQNHGLMTESLRGWVLCSDALLLADPEAAAREMYVFREDISVRPYGRVVLYTGAGAPGWYPTTDGKHAYVAFWGRRDRIWSCVDQVHLLHIACSRRLGVTEGAIAPDVATVRV
jgi:hypothetical protein